MKTRLRRTVYVTASKTRRDIGVCLSMHRGHYIVLVW
jgi:hypothetical protein